MNELLKSLSDMIGQTQKLCGALTNAINYVHNISAEAEGKIKSANDRETINISRSAALDGRESEVAKIENIVKLETEGRESLRQAKELTARLEDERTAFDKARKGALKEIVINTAKLADDNKLLEKGWQELRAKEKTYRAEIEGDIMKRFKK